MISDFLKAEGILVTHILDATNSKQHEYTQCARLVDARVSIMISAESSSPSVSVCLGTFGGRLADFLARGGSEAE